jgi:hypothetical protein
VPCPSKSGASYAFWENVLKTEWQVIPSTSMRLVVSIICNFLYDGFVKGQKAWETSHKALHGFVLNIPMVLELGIASLMFINSMCFSVFSRNECWLMFGETRGLGSGVIIGPDRY